MSTPQSRPAAYEPPLVHQRLGPGRLGTAHHRELAAGRTAAALITVLKGLRADRLFTVVPRFAAAKALQEFFA